jgi:hypothetical protein
MTKIDGTVLFDAIRRAGGWVDANIATQAAVEYDVMTGGKRPEGETLGKPGCVCVWGNRNDIAYHVPTCPWRIAMIGSGRVKI